MRDSAARQAGPDRPTLAIVMKGWPRLSETFIAQELALLEAEGLRFDIWALRKPYDVKRHPLHDQVQAEARYLPEYLRDAPLRVLRGLLWALPRRRFWAILPLWLADLARDRTLSRLRRMGQGLVLARELPAQTRALYVHFMHTPASATRYAARLRGLPWAFSAHAKDIWTTSDWEKREKIADARFGATCTAYGAAELRRLAPADSPERIALVYHGLDLSRFPDPPSDRVFEPPTTERPFEILSVGRLVEKKGFDRLLDALALMPADTPWRWRHLGGGELTDPLRAQAERLGIDDRITWDGPRDQTEVVAAMRAADLFALPSRVAASGDRDGLPNVLMEAASQGLPILATPVAAIPEFVEDGVHGRLVDDAPPALADAMTALARAPEDRARMAEAAYRRLCEDFGAGAGVARLVGLLRALLDAGRDDRARIEPESAEPESAEPESAAP